jgi:PAS domain S-box-containing protein
MVGIMAACAGSGSVAGRKQSGDKTAGGERHRSLLMAMPLGYAYIQLVSDHTGRAVDLGYLEVNEAFARLCGKSVQEMVGKTFTQVLKDASHALLPMWLDLLGQVSTRRVPCETEYFSLALQRWLHLHAFSVEAGRVAVFVEDVTAKRTGEGEKQHAQERLELEVAARTMRLDKANEALRSEVDQRERVDRELQLFRTLVDQSSDALLITEPESGRILDVNLRTCSLLGLTRHELLELRALAIDPSLSDEAAWARVVAGLRSAGRRLRETRFRHKDGTLIPVEVSARYVRGTPHDFVVAFARDVRERVQQEEEYRTILRTAMDGFAIVDAQGRFLEVNEAYCGLLGYSREELLSMNLLQVEMDPPDGCRRTDLGRSTNQGYERFESLQRTRDGGSRWLEVSMTHLKRPKGCFFMFFRDITDRRRTDLELANKVRELARSNAALEQFAYAASHDLQEPLRTITSFVQLLARRCASVKDEESREFMTHILQSTVRMKALVDDLLEFGRVDSSKRSYVPIDCNMIVRQVLDSVQESVRTAQARVTVRKLPMIAGDPVQIRQLFLNLIANAIKFRAERTPEIQISCRKQGSELVFSVQDNGIGIEKQFLDRIFVIFQRLHPRERYPGTGIGLPLCKRIVEAHGGRIWAESVPGEGSVFRFTLPLHNLGPEVNVDEL